MIDVREDGVLQSAEDDLRNQSDQSRKSRWWWMDVSEDPRTGGSIWGLLTEIFVHLLCPNWEMLSQLRIFSLQKETEEWLDGVVRYRGNVEKVGLLAGAMKGRGPQKVSLPKPYLT